MDKLKRVLSGNDSPNEENRGIMGDVCIRHKQIKRCTMKKKIKLKERERVCNKSIAAGTIQIHDIIIVGVIK